VTIPAEIREQAGLLPHTEVDFEFDGEAVRIVRTHNRKNTAEARSSSPSCVAGERSR
jgi:hypothetical protein